MQFLCSTVKTSILNGASLNGTPSKNCNLKPTFKAQAEHTNGILGLKEKLRTNVQFEGKKMLLQRKEEKI